MLGSKNQVIINRQNLAKAKDKAAQQAQNNKSMLERLYLFFDYLNYDAALLPVTEENLVEQLIVSVGEKTPDDDETELRRDYLKDHTMIQIMYATDLVNAANKNQNPEKEENYHILQLFSKLPIRFPVDKIWKVQQLLFALNQVLPIGALGIDKEKVIYYRYTIITEKKEISFENMTQIVQIIDFFLRKFRRKITLFVEGKALMNTILKEIETVKFAEW